MDQEEANNLKKEISDSIDELGREEVVVISPDSKDILTEGYQVKIEKHLETERILCVKSIAEKHGLATTRELTKLSIIIYRPAGTRIFKKKERLTESKTNRPS